MAAYLVFNVFGQLAAAVSLQLMQQAAPVTAAQALQLGVAVALGVAGGVMVQDSASLACRGKRARLEETRAEPASEPGNEHGSPILGSPTWGDLSQLPTLSKLPKTASSSPFSLPPPHRRLWLPLL